MTVYSQINQIPSPELTDIPNAQTAFQAVSAVIDSLLVPRFASTALRDAYITSPVEGQICYVSGGYGIELYDGTRWVKQTALKYGVGSTSNSANVMTETTVLTLTNVTFLNGYAYRIVHAGKVTNTSADYTVWNVRKTNVSGTVYVTANVVATVAGNHQHVAQYVYNNTGSDITTDIVLTGVVHSGTTVYTGSATTPRYMTVELVGRASDMISMGIGSPLS